MMSRLKERSAVLTRENCDEQQQQIVNDFIYGELPENKKDTVKSQIKTDRIMLKSALHSLSHQVENETFAGENQLQSSSKEWTLTEWLQNLTASWLTIPVMAVATIMLTALVFQLFSVLNEQHDEITIASFQDNNNIRYLAQNRMPGIGFFTSARQQSEPYQNIQISLNDNRLLQLEWQTVKNAQDYNLKLSSYSKGNKSVREKITTLHTQTTIKLTDADFNRRFEWILSGDTSDGKTFITSGGFVLNRKNK